MSQAAANYNGTQATSYFKSNFNVRWPTKITFSVNSSIIKTLSSAEESYAELRKILNAT